MTKLILLLIASLTSQALALEVDFSATLQQEWSYASARGETQKAQSLLDLEWQTAISDKVFLTGILRYQGEYYGNIEHRDQAGDNFFAASKPHYINAEQQIELREIYVDFYLGESAWRLGRQQVVWGQSDGLKVLDKINPQSFDEFILDSFEDSRIPLWMATVEFPWRNGQLQVLWIADSSSHELAQRNTHFAVTSPNQIPEFNAQLGFAGNHHLDNKINNSDVGLRWSAFIQGWDITVNYLYHYLDFAAFKNTGDQQILAGEYTRSHLLGGTLSNAVGDFTIRAETGVESQQNFIGQQGSSIDKPELSAVIGLDWSGFADTLISGQIFASYIGDYQSHIVRDKTQLRASLLWQQNFANETWQWQVLGLFSVNQGDRLIRPKLRYSWRDNVDIWLSADIFSGNSRGLFGQFKQQDRVSFGFEWGY